jgi:hypothetical protein
MAMVLTAQGITVGGKGVPSHCGKESYCFVSSPHGEIGEKKIK